MNTEIINCAATVLPLLVRAGLWLGVAWLMLCRLIKIGGADSRKLVNVLISLSFAGALGHAAAVFVPFSANALVAIQLATAGGLFGHLLVFSPEWANGAPAVTRRR